MPTLKQHPIVYTIKPWFGVLVPAGTPSAVVERLRSAKAKVVATPQHREKLPAGALPLFLAKAEFVTMVDADRAAW